MNAKTNKRNTEKSDGINKITEELATKALRHEKRILHRREQKRLGSFVF
jgi:hypothetical protein